jgi:hypothetical protein
MFFFSGGGTYVTRYCGHFWPIVEPQMIDEGDYGAIGGMMIGRGNRSTRRKPAPAPFCPPQRNWDLFSQRWSSRAMGMTTYLYVPPMLGAWRCIPPLHHTSFWFNYAQGHFHLSQLPDECETFETRCSKQIQYIRPIFIDKSSVIETVHRNWRWEWVIHKFCRCIFIFCV